MAYVKTWSPIWLVGPLADRPLATAFRGTYTADDEDDGTTYRSDGVTWSQVGAGVSATGGGPVAAEDVSVDSTTLVGTGTDVQAVLEELDNGIADHIADGSAAHAASAISASSTTLVGVATDVQGVLEELDNGIADHLADTTDAHAGTAITNTPAGGIAATTVQAAINELDSEKAAVASAVMDGDAAGGVLAGTFPNPSFAADMATQAELDAAIAALPTRFLPFRSGLYYGPAFGATANSAFTQSTLYAMPFYVPVTTTFDKIAVVCVTGAASSAVRLGIYSDSAGVPDALILDAGTAATTSSSINAEKTISQALTPGWYWLACVSQGGAPTLQGCSGNNNNPVLGVPTANPFSNGPQHGYSQPTITAGLPSPWGATKTQQQALPIVWMVPH